MRYVCPKCFNIIDRDDYYEVHEENCSGELVEVDDQMAFIVQQLWLRGIATLFCCAGHPENAKPTGYILLSKHAQGVAQAVKRSDPQFKYIRFDYDYSNHRYFSIRSGKCSTTFESVEQSFDCQTKFLQFMLKVIHHLGQPKYEVEEMPPTFFEEFAQLASEGFSIEEIREKMRHREREMLLREKQQLEFELAEAKRRAFAKTKRALANLRANGIYYKFNESLKHCLQAHRVSKIRH